MTYTLIVVLLRQRAKRSDPPLAIALFQSAIPATILTLPATLLWAILIGLVFFSEMPTPQAMLGAA